MSNTLQLKQVLGKFNLPKLFAFIILYFYLFNFHHVSAQTSGMIYKRASGSGASVLNPTSSNDGYVSAQSTGFTGGDMGATHSEVPYRFFPQMGTGEPLSDLLTGSSGGHTDLAQNPLAMYFDGNNILFRVRLGGASTASKGYSFLFDTDGVFNQYNSNGALVPYTNPTNVKNLGFEYEVVLAANFDVIVYKHTASNNTDGNFTSNEIWKASLNGGYEQYSQRSIAYSTEGSSADYFYDFYVPLSAFNGGFTPTTAFRTSGSTVTSAQTGLTGTISDIGGIDDRIYGNEKNKIWADLIPAFPSTTLNQLQTSEFGCIKSAVPTITSNVKQYDTTISGVSGEVNGTTVKVYKGGNIASDGTLTGATLIGTGSVTNGSWTVTLNQTIALNDVIRATATVVGKCESLPSSSKTASDGSCAALSPAAPGKVNGDKGAQGPYTVPGTYTGNVTIKIYRLMENGTWSNSSTDVFASGAAATSFTTTVTTAGQTFTYSFAAGQGQSLRDGTFVVTAQLGSGCESAPSAPACLGNRTTPTATPTINTAASSPTTIYTTSSSATFSGTIGQTNGANSILIYVLKRKGSATTGYSYFSTGYTTTISNPAVNGTTSFSITVPGSYLATLENGDVLTVNAVAQGTSGYCSAEASTTFVINRNSFAPTITGTYCTSTSITKVTGTSAEAGGTIIKLYTSSNTLIGQATVSSAGYWSASINAGILTPNTSFYATATAASKNESQPSSTVTVTSKPSGSGITIQSTIIEGATSVSGTSSTGGTLRLYVDGTFVKEAVITAGSWTLSGFSKYDLAAGLPVTATIAANGATGCSESDPSAAVIVSCSPPDKSRTITPQTQYVCSGSSATISIPNSEDEIVYQIFNVTTGAFSGASQLGNGGELILTSAALTTNASLKVVALKIGGATCTTDLTGSATSNTALISQVTILTLPDAPTLSAPSSVCPGKTAKITITNPQKDHVYQLYRGTVKEGNAITYTSGTLEILTAAINQNTTFKVVVIDPKGCKSTSSEVTINSTCPSTYTVKPAYDKSTYTQNEVIAYPDFETTATTFTLKSGNLLSGTALNNQTGEIYVTDPLALETGTTDVQIEAIDQMNNARMVPVTYSIDSDGSGAQRPGGFTALPVALTTFRGTYNKGSVTLNWATASEKNNKMFAIERSNDAVNFTKIGEVAGSGTTQQAKNYAFADNKVNRGTYYYRLKQVDVEGKFEYSSIIMVKVTAVSEALQITTYPNPTTKDVTIEINEVSAGTATIIVRDLLGNTLNVTKKEVTQGLLNYTLNLENLATGTYIISTETPGKNFMSRIIKN